MTSTQRIKDILIGLFTLGLCALMILYPDMGLPITAMVLSISLTFSGIRSLFFYFTMSRFMVGGKAMLYIGILTLDLGLFTSTLADTPRIYIITYLVGIHAFTGAVNILRGLEAKRFEGASWRLKVFHGVLNLLVAACSIFFLNEPRMLSDLFCLGLGYSAVIRIVSAFRKTAVVYIQ